MVAIQAAWVSFAPDVNMANSSSWQLSKLGRPIAPLEVMYNGSHSQHAVSDEGVTVTGIGSAAWEQLNVRQAPGTALHSCLPHIDSSAVPELVVKVAHKCSC